MKSPSGGTPSNAPTRHRIDTEQLSDYLHDHLAGGSAALEILDRLRQTAKDPDIVILASELLPEIHSDHDRLSAMVSELKSGSGFIKRICGWVVGTLSSIKLGRFFTKRLGPLEALELLSVGIIGKRAMWRTLDILQSQLGMCPDTQFATLITRANDQYNRVEELRLGKVVGRFVGELVTTQRK